MKYDILQHDIIFNVQHIYVLFTFCVNRYTLKSENIQNKVYN